MSFDPQSARYSDILLAVKNRVVEVFDVDPSLVRIVANDRYRVHQVDSGSLQIYLRSYGPEPDVDHGGGRRSRPKKRLLRVYLYYRNSLDQAGEDETALTAEDGLFDKEDLLLDALDDYWPQSDDVPLTIEPLHPLNSAEGPPLREEEDDIGVTRIHLDFEIRYVGRNQNPAP